LTVESPRAIRVIGPGRAGGSLGDALSLAGWNVQEPIRRGDDVSHAAFGVDLVIIATPDAAIAEVASQIEPVPTTVVAHMAGSLGLEVLGNHPRRAAIHPLVALPDRETGSLRLRSDAWFAVAADGSEALGLVDELVAALGGRSFVVADDRRAEYHAAAVIASNHLVALLGQVERAASSAGIPFDAFLELARSTIENVARLGPTKALTGPAARGDWATIERHRAALPDDELEAYDALMRAARRLVDGAERGNDVLPDND
jgi:predicted short-subunit dehydrogenase-like oxidoreductase (DUF2520 family)